MQYAIVEGVRSQAFKGMKGTCEQCNKNVIAKCGNVKLHHWAHQSITDCDSWWEPETPWHRQWKSFFPEEFREVSSRNPLTGELHRADIYTCQKITIEFQHSHLESEERAAREDFHQNLVWVVDGTRLKKDFQKFLQGITHLRRVSDGVFSTNRLDECFAAEWIKSSVPVLFDFLGSGEGDNQEYRQHLYCLLPVRLGESAIIKVISRQSFIGSTSDGQWLPWVENYLAGIRQVNLEQEQARNVQAARTLGVVMRPYYNRRSRRL